MNEDAQRVYDNLARLGQAHVEICIPEIFHVICKTLEIDDVLITGESGCEFLAEDFDTGVLVTRALVAMMELANLDPIEKEVATVPNLLGKQVAKGPHRCIYCQKTKEAIDMFQTHDPKLCIDCTPENLLDNTWPT